MIDITDEVICKLAKAIEGVLGEDAGFVLLMLPEPDIQDGKLHHCYNVEKVQAVVAMEHLLAEWQKEEGPLSPNQIN